MKRKGIKGRRNGNQKVSGNNLNNIIDSLLFQGLFSDCKDFYIVMKNISNSNKCFLLKKIMKIMYKKY